MSTYTLENNEYCVRMDGKINYFFIGLNAVEQIQ